jgi:hypothetical protein
MDQGFSVVIYPVTDLAQAKVLYRTLLGVEPYVDEAYYVGFRVEDQEIGLDPHGHSKGMTGPVGYWRLDRQNHLSVLRSYLSSCLLSSRLCPHMLPDKFHYMLRGQPRVRNHVKTRGKGMKHSRPDLQFCFNPSCFQSIRHAR